MKIKKIDNKQSGFSMFELLVVISIMAILTAVTVVSFGGLSKKTRDSRRMNDLEKVRLALEGYKQVNGSYPTNIGSLTNPTTSFLERIPSDPKGVGYTYYMSVSAATGVYTLCAQMEDLGSTNIGSCGSGYCGSGLGCNYRLVNP